ncbi:endonuclease [Allostreptomyces psammosilenae]|uniref:Endonuclease III n=1 Tax=Allostreptomyces psammosilenae TaxID=1892865 RepID=A0A852ZYD8_9ACTN|nr:endonuclease [Allostreptomyces psammosilenae]NYI03631.1 endonuclease III [Allostreptomyces psammosilenae]
MAAKTGAVKERARVAEALLETHGTTWAEQAGIRLRDTPASLYQLLVLAMLISARIRADIAVAAARCLSEAGMRDARRMAAADWQERVDALGRGGYRRYDERTATMLGKGAELLLRRWHGDLRRLHQEADGDPEALRERLQEFPGIGPVGADVFLREAQAVWEDVRPYVDDLAAEGAKRLDLPRDAEELAELVAPDHFVELVAGLVRAARSKDVVEDVRRAAA